MIYVSMAEIAVKSYDQFQLHYDEVDGVNRSNVSAEDYEGSTTAFHAAAGTFFAGLVITALLDKVVVWASHDHNYDTADGPVSSHQHSSVSQVASET
jgi:hypothetical protein